MKDAMSDISDKDVAHAKANDGKLPPGMPIPSSNTRVAETRGSSGRGWNSTAATEHGP
jgi:hypothetical protein